MREKCDPRVKRAAPNGPSVNRDVVQSCSSVNRAPQSGLITLELFSALRGFCALPDGAMAMATLTARLSLGSAHHIQSLHVFPLKKSLASR
jgi:hypothetical protein